MKSNHKPFIIVFACFAFMLMGCPTGIDYPPGTPGTEKIDKDLIGNWYNNAADKEVKSIEITAVDKYKLKAVVTEAGSMYSLESKELYGWCTEVGDMNIVYFQSTSETEKQYYTYLYKYDGGKLETYVVALLDGGIDSVLSTQSYRDQIATSMKMAGGISDTTVWMKK